MKCECGGKTWCYGTQPMRCADGTTFIRRCRMCDKCGVAFYTAEVPIQLVMPEHPAALASGGTGRPSKLPIAAPARIKAAAARAADSRPPAAAPETTPRPE